MLALINDIGGPVVAILILFSVTATAITLAKLCQYWSLRPPADTNPDQLLALWVSGEHQQFQSLIKSVHNGRTKLLANLVALTQNDTLNTDQLRTEAMRRARLLLAQYEAYLKPLDVIATLAPLLGLFGTVLGMIEAFRAMEAAGSQVDPAILSGGIWQALLTTAAGLAVAIPVSIIHSWLERNTETMAATLQNDIDTLLNLSAATALTRAPVEPVKATKEAATHAPNDYSAMETA